MSKTRPVLPPVRCEFCGTLRPADQVVEGPIGFVCSPLLDCGDLPPVAEEVSQAGGPSRGQMWSVGQRIQEIGGKAKECAVAGWDRSEAIQLAGRLERLAKELQALRWLGGGGQLALPLSLLPAAGNEPDER